MGFRQEWEEQARKQGLEQGRMAVVMKQLVLRFGDLEPAVVERVGHMSKEALDVLTERILTAETLDEALADLDQP